MLSRRSIRIIAIVVLTVSVVAAIVGSFARYSRISIKTSESLVQANPLAGLFQDNASTTAIIALLRAHPKWTNADLGNGTPLYYASGYKREEVVHFLLTHGGDPNLMPQGCSEPPIVPAIGACDMVILKDLLAHGADPSIKDGYGRSMPQLAHDADCVEAERLLNSVLKARRSEAKRKRG